MDYFLYQRDYKPFGRELWAFNSKNRRSWIGKEEDAESGLGDFGVRKYDEDLGRFLSCDALWEKFRGWNPYHYSYNNPVLMKDDNGMGPGDGPSPRDIGLEDSYGSCSPDAGRSVSGMRAFFGRIFGGSATTAGSGTPPPGTSESGDTQRSLPQLTNIASSQQSANAGRGSQVRVNAAEGKAFEQKVEADQAAQGNTVVRQVTIRVNGVNSRMDVTITNGGNNVSLVEAKGSATAPLTANQKSVIASIQNGAQVTVRGNGLREYGLPSGSLLNVQSIQIARPSAGGGQIIYQNIYEQ